MILLAGATGYTGRYVLRALLRAGERVRCLVRDPATAAEASHLGAEVVRGDLSSADAIAGLDGADAMVSVAHIRFAPQVVEACAKAGVARLVAFSSAWRFSKVKTPERDAVLCGEEALAKARLDVTVLLPTMIYGPGEDRNVSRLRAYIRRHRLFPMLGSGERPVQPVYVSDVADAASAVLRRSGTIGHVYAVAGAFPLAYREMVDAVAAAERRTPVKVYVPLSLALPLARLYGAISQNPLITPDQVLRMGEDRALDISRSRRDFGYHPRDFHTGLRDLLEADGAPC